MTGDALVDCLHALEHGRGVPSTVVAEVLVAGLGLGAPTAARLRASAVPDAGRTYPLRRPVVANGPDGPGRGERPCAETGWRP